MTAHAIVAAMLGIGRPEEIARLRRRPEQTGGSM